MLGCPDEKVLVVAIAWIVEKCEDAPRMIAVVRQANTKMLESFLVSFIKPSEIK